MSCNILKMPLTKIFSNRTLKIHKFGIYGVSDNFLKCYNDTVEMKIPETLKCLLAIENDNKPLNSKDINSLLNKIYLQGMLITASIIFGTEKWKTITTDELKNMFLECYTLSENYIRNTPDIIINIDDKIHKLKKIL